MRTLLSDYRHGSVRHWRGLLFAAVGASLWFGSCLEAATLGPYTTWFNQRMKSRAGPLIGQPEANVERVLGAANYVRVDEESRTFNYHPYPWFPFSKFQVHCYQGVVTSLEMFDD